MYLVHCLCPVSRSTYFLGCAWLLISLTCLSWPLSLSTALRRVNNHRFLSTFCLLDVDHSTFILKVVEEETDTQERLRNVAEDTRLAKAMVGRLIRQSSAIFTSWYSHPCVILSPLEWAGPSDLILIKRTRQGLPWWLGVHLPTQGTWI